MADQAKDNERERIKLREAKPKPMPMPTPLDISKIKTLPFPDNQYFKEEFKKSQICLHHTASGKGVDGDYKTWLSNPVRIATCVIIDYNGQINQCFPSKYWGYHLGLSEPTFKKLKIPYKPLDKTTIGIEIDAWGALKERDGKFYAYPNNWGTTGTAVIVPKESVTIYPNGFKGFYAYESYTPAQIQATEDLLIYWHKEYGIPLDYNTDMWNLSPNALSGKAGVWTHVSFREGNEKSDCHPSQLLMDMLMNLHKKVQ